MRKRIFYSFSLLISFFLGFSSVHLQAKIVVWDLNGVLIKTSKPLMINEIGFFKLLFSFVENGQNPQTGVFKTLETIGGKQVPPKGDLRSHHRNTPLPEVMCQWQKGERTGASILYEFNKMTRDEGLRSTARAMFTPEILSAHMRIIKKGNELLKLCDTEENTMMILSNYDPLGFNELLKNKKINSIFSHFKQKNRLISGRLGAMKPYNDIFEMLKGRLVEIDRRFQDPKFLKEECLFLDDQPENIEAAIEAGVSAVLIHKENFLPAISALVQGNFISIANRKLNLFRQF